MERSKWWRLMKKSKIKNIHDTKWSRNLQKTTRMASPECINRRAYGTMRITIAFQLLEICNKKTLSEKKTLASYCILNNTIMN